jgi:dTDP-4-amino-4,6-dideoxygalactose transaminase
MASNPSNPPLHLFVPVFRVDECLAEIRECLERGWTGLGFKTTEFEEQWKRATPACRTGTS